MTGTDNSYKITQVNRHINRKQNGRLVKEAKKTKEKFDGSKATRSRNGVDLRLVKQENNDHGTSDDCVPDKENQSGKAILLA